MRTKILITGASGFVGGSFCNQYSTRSDLEIRGLGRRETNLPNYIRADLTQPIDLDWIPDVVIHAAAKASPWGTLTEFRRQNVLTTQNMVEFSARHRVKKFIYISSSSVFYNNKDQLNLTENSPIGPDFVNYYAQTKFEGEEITRSFPGTWAILRPRAVFGPRDTVLFPRILRAAKQRSMIKITRPEAPAIGDLIYIDSLCDYILRAALDSSITGTFNLTNNHPVDIQAFIANICSRLNLPPAPRSISKRQAMCIATLLEVFFRIFIPQREPPITRFGVSVLSSSKTFDVSKCLRELGPPSVSLEEGLARFITWQEQQWKQEQF